MIASSLKMPPWTGYGGSTLGLLLAVSHHSAGAWWGVHVLGMDVQDASGAAKSVVPTAKIDGSDAELAQSRGTHDAGLDGDIEVRLAQDAGRVDGEDLRDGNELGVTRSVQRAVRVVHAATDNAAVMHEDAADGRLIGLQGQVGHLQRLAHEALVVGAVLLFAQALGLRLVGHELGVDIICRLPETGWRRKKPDGFARPIAVDGAGTARRVQLVRLLLLSCRRRRFALLGC